MKVVTHVTKKKIILIIEVKTKNKSKEGITI